jgi:Flp pilus assembly pilin Flp
MDPKERALAAIAGNFQTQKERAMNLLELIKKLHREESGQDLVEYALVLVAIGGGVFAVQSSLSSALASAVGGLQAKITTWTT